MLEEERFARLARGMSCSRSWWPERPFSRHFDSPRSLPHSAPVASGLCNEPKELRHVSTTEAGSAASEEFDPRHLESLRRHLEADGGCLPIPSGTSSESASILNRDLGTHEQAGAESAVPMQPIPMPSQSAPSVQRVANGSYNGCECPTTPENPVSVDSVERFTAVQLDSGQGASHGQQAKQARVWDSSPPAENARWTPPGNGNRLEPLYAGVFLREDVAVSLRNRCAY